MLQEIKEEKEDHEEWHRVKKVLILFLKNNSGVSQKI
jgi:hypothetical protein